MEGPGAKPAPACGTMKYVLHSSGAIPRQPGRGGRRAGRTQVNFSEREADFS